MKNIGYSLEREVVRLKHGCQKCGGTGKVKEILGPIRHTIGDKSVAFELVGCDKCGGGECK